ncbi:2-dehydro-3-deoxygalactonokinase [Thalassovita taeanensis]|uniref:2-dehydro-3-deoxygalactonokinase n=1 Tax=Thalassovita taeanensis TaxID=657014 RepID=A0A1H9C7D2_9RHOB|nr:2-dehydro-3-deoxygalactonokinase [Thalassovita taeanensis]SEP96857.1 2-dehydro-3-deoxygalactonokinase [Thalassovita taeanensis]
MTQIDWFGVIEDDGKAQGWGFAGGAVCATASGADAAEVMAQLGADTALIVRAGEAAQPVPCALRPDALPLGDLVQAAPLGRLPAPVRLHLLGLVTLHTNWDGVACVIGPDRSHWVQISAGEAVSFQSFLTPRLWHALNAGDAADAQAVADTQSRPERLATHLSSAELRGDFAAIAGHLIGAELSAARPYWLGQQVAVLGDSALVPAYCAALAAQGVPVATPENTAPAGLVGLRNAGRITP